MLEITRIRNEKEAIIEGLKKRNIDATATLNKIIETDQNWRASKTELETTSAELNQYAKEIGDLFKKGKQNLKLMFFQSMIFLAMVKMLPQFILLIEEDLELRLETIY